MNTCPSKPKNEAERHIHLDRSEGSVELTILEDCPIYEDCMGIQYGRAKVDCDAICGGVTHFGDLNEDGLVDQSDLNEYESKFSEITSSGLTVSAAKIWCRSIVIKRSDLSTSNIGIFEQPVIANNKIIAKHRILLFLKRTNKYISPPIVRIMFLV